MELVRLAKCLAACPCCMLRLPAHVACALPGLLVEKKLLVRIAVRADEDFLAA